MKRVESDGEWSLFCPHEAPGLTEVYGSKFEDLYTQYEQRPGLARKTVRAQTIWNKIIQSQIETGTPYLLYKDACNQKSNQKNLGTIKCSNLCVAPETPILTKQGYYPISSMVGEEVEVWNGNEFSKTTILQTGADQDMVRVTFSNEVQLDCTPYHKFHVNVNGEERVVSAAELKEEDTLVQCSFPVLQGHTTFDIQDPYECGCSESNCPLNATLECRLQWLAGLVDGNGDVITDESGYESVLIMSSELKLVKSTLLLLQTLGIDANIELVKEVYYMSIQTSDVIKLRALGFATRKQTFYMFMMKKDTINTVVPSVTQVKVVSIEQLELKSDTYCFNEPRMHRGIFGGVITGQCSEILEYTAPDEVAVCNLASISLPAFVKDGQFDFDSLQNVVRVAIKNLNKVIDENYYPIPEARNSNMRHRPTGLGVQGLADAFIKMRYAFDSAKAASLNEEIFAAMYYAALDASCEVAKKEGPYESWSTSPAAQGQLQYHLWGAKPSGKWDWAGLQKRIAEHGLRNSLLMCQMPTASTSQILGNNESCECHTSNIYARRTSSGEFTMLNQHLVRDLLDLGLWTDDLRNQLIADEGSVQHLAIPDDLKALYKTSWEISQKVILDHAAARGKYICQSQSTNIFIAEPSLAKISSVHFYAWKAGLKTGIYYLRSLSRATTTKFTVDAQKAIESRKRATEFASDSVTYETKGLAAGPVCTREMREAGCISCSG